MKKGKILTNPLIRSVLRHPYPQKEERALTRNGAVLFAEEDGTIYGTSQSTLIYGGDYAEALCLYRSLNAALAAGMIPETLQLLLTVPVSETEQMLSQRMEILTELAECENLRIAGGHTTVSDKVSSPVLSTVISGKFAKREALLAEGRLRKMFTKASGQNLSGPALVMTGLSGQCGAGILLREKREVLRGRFSEEFLSEAALSREMLSVRKAAEMMRDFGAVMHPVSEGGLFSALYSFAEGFGCGFTVDLYEVPIRQETVEICNFLDVNPYELLSTGALVAAVLDGEACVSALQGIGVQASVIGCLQPGKQKILLKRDEQRYLERPKQDPLMCLPDFG